MSEIECRAAEVVGVSFPKRSIELTVIPYEKPAEIVYKGRLISEVVSRGAFDGIQRRTNRIKVNRDHDMTKPVGRVLALHPTRSDGLAAELKISPGPLGDETLALADDGVLDASAGFAVMDRPGAEVWEGKSSRRLNHLWLHHVAMVADPAYDDANVIAVRHAEVTAALETTPNLARLELGRWLDLKAAIDARYGVG